MKKEQFDVYEKEPVHGKDKNSVILAPYNTKEEASKKACELLRKHFITESHPNYDAHDDDYIIRNYTDEWSWFMQGWQETINPK